MSRFTAKITNKKNEIYYPEFEVEIFNNSDGFSNVFEAFNQMMKEGIKDSSIDDVNDILKIELFRQHSDYSGVASLEKSYYTITFDLNK